MTPVRPPATTSRLAWPAVALRTDVGLVRTDNQDHVIALTMLLPTETGGVPFGFYAVADGMGGLADGGRASHTAAELVSGRVVRDLLLPMLNGQGGPAGGRTVAEILTDALSEAGRQIHADARQTGRPSGTTFSGVVLMGRQLIIAHVGDSRIYLGGPDGLRPLTEDHSVVARLVEMGQMTADEVRSNPQRNALYRSLGGGDDVVVQTGRHAWKGGDWVLLCSDGLWDLLDESELAAVLAETPDPDEAADTMIALANERGGRDNISVVLVHLPEAL
jgi:serine/threonine protein phosphatase PrpC